MAKLYCEKHGRRYEAAIVEGQAAIREDGESVLVVKGKLISGPWRCDHCNAVLRKGKTAYLGEAFPASMTGRMDAYGFEMEREYFALRGDDRLRLYGTPWPGGTIPEMLRQARWSSFRPKPRRARSATELFMPLPSNAPQPEPQHTAAADDDEPEDYPTLAFPPLYVLRTAESCPECGEAMHVYTLGCGAYRDYDHPDPVEVFHFLREIESVPEELTRLLAARCPGYFLDRENESGKPYLMNHCRCGAKLDDDFLHGDVGAAFFPDVPEGYGNMKLFLLPIDAPIAVTSSYAIGGDEYLDFDQVEEWQAIDAYPREYGLPVEVAHFEDGSHPGKDSVLTPRHRDIAGVAPDSEASHLGVIGYRLGQQSWPSRRHIGGGGLLRQGSVAACGLVIVAG